VYDAGCGGRNWRSWLKGWMWEKRSWWNWVVRTWTSLRQTMTFASKYLTLNIIIIIIVLLELQTYLYNHTVNIQQAVTQDRNGTAQTWSVCNKGSHSFICHPHTNLSLSLLPAARRRRPLAVTHCTYPWRDGQAELTWVAGYIPG